MNPYVSFVAGFERLVREGRNLPLGGFPRPSHKSPEASAPRALIFSPHPDDECIIGGLALRLVRQAGARVVNVAVTQGSKKERQAARFEELRLACDYLGFDLVQTQPGGLERISRRTREKDPGFWKEAVDVVARILAAQRPDIVFVPHDLDWNSTHEGTHVLVMDAMATALSASSCYVVETEFWGAMTSPNLMVESSVNDLADMVGATSFHAGEVQRNPYHLLLPAWMQDNVRRGGELVGGQGGAAPDYMFATLYRLRRWVNGRLERFYEGGRNLAQAQNPRELFPEVRWS